MLADVDEESAKKVARKLEGSSLVYSADVIRAEEIEALVQRAVEEWDGLDVMVNNAGVGVAATTLETREENHELVMDLPVRGTFLGMRCAIPAIRDSGRGSVVNISSTAALVGLNARAVYCAAKGAILATTCAAAIDHIEEGVRVNCIAPGTVDTPWISRITSGYDGPEEATPGRRPVSPTRTLRLPRGDSRHGRVPGLGRSRLRRRCLHNRGRRHDSTLKGACLEHNHHRSHRPRHPFPHVR
jgi:NAD(P)-dependent dehydrogenase (short-subunit alcohol dehydrogenase family)